MDIEAYAEGRLIGGFRKIFRPPVPIHRPRDPIYAESEIFIHPYPPRAFEPTEVGMEIRNPTEEPQTVTVTFSAADFGIGLSFTPIHEPVVVEVPPLGMARPVIMWVPPRGGLWCIQVAIVAPGHREPFISRRNIDVGEPLEPNTPHARPFLVGNPYQRPVTITLGMIPHLPDWQLELSQDVLPNVLPGQTRVVTLTVTPPADLPADGDVIVDVEAFVEGELIGGFRKIFRPPVPVHRPKDPVYAESEIGVDPYPAIAGQPTKLSVDVFNPTDQDRFVTVTFSIANFGIGLPFNTANIAPNPIRVFVPKFGAAKGHVIWTPPNFGGHFCVRVTLEMEGHEPIWSQRNIDVGEPLRPGIPHAMTFQVGGWPYTEPVTVSLGLRLHRDGWHVALSQDVAPNVAPGQTVAVTLTVTPPDDAVLGTGDPIVDVEGFVNGELIGGFRKLDRPPVPIHKPHEKGYAESEIMIEPYPPQVGVDSLVSTVVQNTSGTTMTVDLKFGWADFGMGIPFTTTGMVPYTRSLTLSPAMTQTATVTWTPTQAGHQCVQVWLSDPEGVYEPQRSQRNVDVTERPPCNQTRVFTMTIYNDSPLTATVDVGLITFNVPADWQITVTPTPTLELGPWSSGVVTVTVLIPCPLLSAAMFEAQTIYAVQQASGSVPTIDVEGYVDGELVGGLELQFEGAAPEEPHMIYLPLVLKDW
ncbi:MAG TPA: NEW3 domain-containing protein [Anaerolineae bacterium]|nr:NEW3 domain-containing protein [Anaerolineae bacterium]HQI83197.1 NEW3 domain-containing protein [Anaerolineae bacterium]